MICTRSIPCKSSVVSSVDCQQPHYKSIPRCACVCTDKRMHICASRFCVRFQNNMCPKQNRKYFSENSQRLILCEENYTIVLRVVKSQTFCEITSLFQFTLTGTTLATSVWVNCEGIPNKKQTSKLNLVMIMRK